ncbi:DUF1722 domain-containing protein [Escherichia coli]
MIKKPVIGISGCLAGSAVRFDGGHKRADFLMDKLVEWVTFRPVCPEMAIGLPVPRPALRLVRSMQGNIRMCFSHDQNEDVTERMTEFSRSYMDKLKDVSGFVVCAKSPSCGMERVRVYDENGNRGRKDGVGLFTSTLMEKFSWLPVEEDGRLHDPVLRENFVERVFALHELNHLYKEKLSRRELLAFHSRYKLQLLAHSQAGYKDMGPFVAAIHEWADLESYFEVYRDKLMAILRKPASRKNHTNVLMHIQGYFSNYLSTRQRKELSEVILNYRSGTLPLLAPLTLLKHYLGDQVIVMVTRIIKKSIRKEDVLGRLGGEEFGIIIKGNTQKLLLSIAERIRKNIEEQCSEKLLSHGPEKITVSIGCFTSKENNLSPSEMLVNADKALYQAKRTGKNKVIIHSK